MIGVLVYGCIGEVVFGALPYFCIFSGTVELGYSVYSVYRCIRVLVYLMYSGVFGLLVCRSIGVLGRFVCLFINVFGMFGVLGCWWIGGFVFWCIRGLGDLGVLDN